MKDKTSSRIPAGYVVRPTPAPATAAAETPTHVAEHVRRRLDLLEALGLDAGIVRVAREMAGKHVPSTSKAAADAKLDELLRLLKSTSEEIGAERDSKLRAVIAG